MNGTFCHCNNCPNNDYDNEEGICFLQSGGQCFSAVEETYDKETENFLIIRDFGCISADDQALLQCRGDLVPSFYPRSIKCCNYTDLCNKYLRPELMRRMKIASTGFFYDYKLYLITLLACIVVAALVLLAFAVYIYYRTKRDVRSHENFIESCSIRLQKSRNVFSNYISSSGSGVGIPSLIRTSIGRQVYRYHCLGRGRFTEVYVVNWNATKIAEKVFLSSYEELWFTERKIYETTLLRHDNILGYISSDVLKSGLKTIYTDYHELGSLHNYLDKTCLNYTDFFKLIKSAASGIAYLHTEILGTPKRPAVAHCNITSKNFLLNNGKECVISNFGISVTHISINQELEREADFTFATPRYMAPEVACDTLIRTSFEALKTADVYSLGLVFYEICQRCATVESNRFSVEDHTVPFSNILPKYATVEDVKKLYARKTKDDLLPIPTRWENDPKVLRPFVNSILRECLYTHPMSRPSGLRVKKSIELLESSYSKKDVEIL